MATEITPIGTFAFPSLNEPRENLNKQLEWNVGLVLNEQDAAPILGIIENILAEERDKNPRFPRDNGALSIPVSPNQKKNQAGVKEVVPGEFLIRFKRRYEIRNKRTGETRANSAPVIYDASGQIVQDRPQIGNGTKGKVIFRPYAYDNVQKGVGLYLLGVQIVELSGAEELIQLAPVDGGWTQDRPQEDDNSLASLLSA